MSKNIKYLFLLTAISFFFFEPQMTMAQGKIELSPFAGYQFGGRMRFYEGDLKVQDNANYGIAMDIEVAPDTKVELLWTSMQTTANFRPNYGFGELDYLSTPFNLGVNYFQIGAVREMGEDNIKPFGAFTVGAAYFNPQERTLSDDWRFSVSLGGGAKIWLSDHVGIRLQGRLMMPLYFAGGGISCGIGTGGSGCGIGVGASTALLQGDFSAGLIIALGN